MRREIRVRRRRSTSTTSGVDVVVVRRKASGAEVLKFLAWAASDATLGPLALKIRGSIHDVTCRVGASASMQHNLGTIVLDLSHDDTPEIR